MTDNSVTKSDIDRSPMTESATSRSTIVYNGTQITVNPLYFAEASAVFARYYDPRTQEELNIQSDIPLASFEEFLPAVQRGTCTITYENVSTVRNLAEQWEVARLIAECDRWEKAPEAVLRRLVQTTDRTAVPELVTAVAEALDSFLDIPYFLQIPPKIIGDILSNPQCNVANHQKLLGVLVEVIKLNPGPKASSLLNHMAVDALNPESIERLLTNGEIDLSLVGEFLSNCAQRFIQSVKVDRERIQKLETQIAKFRKQFDDTSASIRSVQRNFDDEHQRHLEHQRELTRLRQSYEADGQSGQASEHGAAHGKKKGAKRKGGTSQFVYYPPDTSTPAPAAKPEPQQVRTKEPPPAPQPKRPKRNNPFSWSPDDES